MLGTIPTLPAPETYQKHKFLMKQCSQNENLHATLDSQVAKTFKIFKTKPHKPKAINILLLYFKLSNFLYQIDRGWGGGAWGLRWGGDCQDY